VYKLWATILKDVRVLRRDRLGLTFMFVMPVLLVMIVTGMQSGTFELVNKNKVPLLLCNRDTGAASLQFIRAVGTMGLFDVRQIPATQNEEMIRERLYRKETLMAVVLPADFSAQVTARTKVLAGKALRSFGLDDSLSGGGKAKQAEMPGIVPAFGRRHLVWRLATGRKPPTAENAVFLHQ
jgi:ABC-2 type transport system permease protein